MTSCRMLLLASATLLISAAIGAAWADEDYGPFKTMKTSAGEVLTDAKGMTLYTFDKDTEGKSNCSGECAEYWPPALASASDKATGDLTIIKRADGSMQWADDGKPLYTYVDDKEPGDMMGDNKNGVWHIVKEED